MAEPNLLRFTTFDRQALVVKLGGDAEFVRGLLAVALQSNERMPGELRAAADRADCDAIARLAHKVKGTAGDLVATVLRERAAGAEMAARLHAGDAAALARALADEVDALLAELRLA